MLPFIKSWVNAESRKTVVPQVMAPVAPVKVSQPTQTAHQSVGKVTNSMSLVSAIRSEWVKFKAVALKIETAVVNDAPKIQGVVDTAAKIVEAGDPAIAPLVSAADTFEEQLAAEFLAALKAGTALVNSTDGATSVTFSAQTAAAGKAIVSTIENAPAIIAAAKAAATPVPPPIASSVASSLSSGTSA